MVDGFPLIRCSACDECNTFVFMCGLSPVDPHSIGDNIQMLLERADGAYCFRLHKDRVYYLR